MGDTGAPVVRVGFFGGTFDPPHIGHLAVAQAAARKFLLERLLMVPTGRQPLKSEAPTASYADRLEMVSLLCEGVSGMEASAIEAPPASSKASINYTIDSVRTLRRTLAQRDEIYVIVGADSFLDLRRWREPEALLAEAEWIVVSRPGFSLQRLDELNLTAEQRARVHPLDEVNVPISATELRRKLHDAYDCAEWVPARVLAYIHAHGLYR